jgi:hypothetical protein
VTRSTALLLAVLASFPALPLAARETVDASAPTALAVTVYRDPDRDEDEEMDPDWPEGFAMITETRTVTLPPGESTIRFEGVAEGMVAVSAIVTGLPGGAIEKNRNAELLSPASLINGTLGNRVKVTRTNPGTGEQVVQDAIVRTRADGGLVLQTGDGFEALRCSGLPERLSFDRVPAGLSPQPVYSVDTRDRAGGTYTVQLTYLAWGFDWQANYVATLAPPGRGDEVKLRMMSWLTLLNDNGQSFPDAELLVVAGTLNVESDFEELAEAPSAPPLRLTCYPLGSTSRGSPVQLESNLNRLPQFRVAQRRGETDEMLEEREANIVVTGSMIASEENLGDLKLYRVPERVTVSAKGLKQIAFLDKSEVEGRLLYRADCSPWNADETGGEAFAVQMILETVNDRRHGLGVALPMGGVAVFEPSAFGEQLVAEERIRDYAAGQDVELELGESSQVHAQCELPESEYNDFDGDRWNRMTATLTNANRQPVRIRLLLGRSRGLHFRGLRGTRTKDGQTIVEVTIPANSRREMTWDVRSL